jgi:hypothetical protein
MVPNVTNNPKLRELRFEHLQNQLGDYLPSDADETMVSFEKYPSLLYRILELVCDRAVGPAGELYFQPLSSYVYADGQQMMSFCGILLHRTDY